MFTPERMHQVNVVVFETEVDSVAKAIVRLGMLHLVQLGDQEEWAENLEGFQARKVSEEIDQLRARVSTLMKNLAIRRLPPGPVDDRHLEVSPSDLTTMGTEVSSLETKVEAMVERRKEIEVRLERLQGILNEVAPLETVGLPPAMTPYTFLEIHYGEVRSENLGYINEKIAPLAAVALQLVHRDDREVILLIGLKTDRLKLKRILREASFEEIEMPEEATKGTGMVTGELEGKVDELRKSIAGVDEELRDISEHNAPAITEYHRSLQVALLLLEVKSYLKKTRKTYIFSGWVPSNKRRLVEQEILRAAKGRAIIEVVPPEEIAGIKHGKYKVPVLLRHPGFFRPFEMLVSSYGLPEYTFIDPTLFVAVTFLAMFGMMFGDIGHGAILMLIGWLLGFRPKRAADATRLVGKLAFYCGISSVVFGFLFGSIFGLEELIPHVWMKPMHNVIYFFKIAIYFGIGMVTLGIVFNIINALRVGDFRTTLFDHAGLVSAIIYWGGIGAVSIFLSNRPVPLKIVIYAIGVPVIVLFLREPITALIQHRRVNFEKGFMTYLMETVIEVVEIFTGYLANTVSFIRVAAFSLAHVGLFIAVFSLVDMVKGKSGGVVYSALILILGNAVIIALEGLVVTIQAIRLEYYEFFGKFFLGGGVAYKPIGLGVMSDREE
ncbi:MAG TPA: V-type ATPase 116kDa subunit family protein [Patescibacteria group bacterium]|nr:V-type ATPase 116kDa subunit family protein [Patescibacteria group bacterium]